MFEAEKMITKRGWYHKRCFACCKCKSQLDYFNCIEGPDDDIYCKVCYLRYWGPGKCRRLPVIQYVQGDWFGKYTQSELVFLVLVVLYQIECICQANIVTL